MPAPAGPVEWRVHPPPRDDCARDTRILAEVRAFRAGVLWSGGLRPRFRDAAGRFVDDDPADPFAHHVVARVDGAIVAAMRVVPLAATDQGFCERMFGTEELEAAIGRVGATRAETWEGSGWAVEPSRRGAAMGLRVLAAASAVARALGLELAVGASGRRYGQLYRILSAGYRRAEGATPVEVEELADEVLLVLGRVAELRPRFRELVDGADDLLRWDRLSPVRVDPMTS